MPKKSDLQHLESECATVDDWTALALRAIEETADQDYAAELAGKAEIDCQGPVDYAELAQFVTEHLSRFGLCRKFACEGGRCLFWFSATGIC